MLFFVKTGPPPPVESERNPLGLEDIPMTQITLPDADLAAALDGVTTDHFLPRSKFSGMSIITEPRASQKQCWMQDLFPCRDSTN